MLRFFEILTEIGAIIAVLLLALAFAEPSAPRQAAGAALALCFVVIPYCLAGIFQRRAMLDRMPPKPAKRPREIESLEPLDF